MGADMPRKLSRCCMEPRYNSYFLYLVSLDSDGYKGVNKEGAPSNGSRCVFLLSLKNLLWAKLRDYAISRVKPNPRQAFLLQVVKLI